MEQTSAIGGFEGEDVTNHLRLCHIYLYAELLYTKPKAPYVYLIYKYESRCKL